MPKWERIDFVYMIKNRPYFEQVANSAVNSNRIKSIEKIVELNRTIGVDGLDLLQRLLDLNPDTRLTACEAIEHPFFDDVRNFKIGG